MTYSKTNKAIILILALCIILAFVYFAFLQNPEKKVDNNIGDTSTEVVKDENGVKPFAMPISDTKNRITKKHFGTYVTPKDSPVTHEVFTGYHTAVDFETFENEQDRDIPIYVICSGKILVKRETNGYGGMVVQNCMFEGELITVVYGHVRLKDMKAEVGTILNSGDFLTNLGTGFSEETSNERKHLHLGIHKGAGIDTRGYIANKDDLKYWIDFEKWVE